MSNQEDMVNSVLEGIRQNATSIEQTIHYQNKVNEALYGLLKGLGCSEKELSGIHHLPHPCPIPEVLKEKTDG